MAEWFKSFSWWMKLKAIIALFGAGGEITMIVMDALPEYHIYMIVASVLAIAITHIIQDKDKDDIVDLFQKRVRSNNRRNDEGQKRREEV